MSSTSPEMAMMLEGVAKSFKKSSRRKESTTLKTELIRLLLRRRKVVEPSSLIEALTDVNLAIPKGKTVGIIGRNGSGKSTLLKLMTGIYTPTRGTLRVNGRISALLELGAGFHPEFTGRENIFINGIILGMSRAELRTRVEDIIAFAELGDFIDEPVRTYSSGMFMRLAFAVATHVDPDILIIDEILSVGDEHFQHKSSAKMKEFRTSGRTIVLVTHELATVESWCDLAVWIDGGRVRAMGKPKEVVGEYRRAISSAESQEAGRAVLSAPGAALPEVAPPPAAPASLVAVRLRNGIVQDGPSAFTSAGRFEVLLDYDATEAAACNFSVELLGPGGVLLFSTSFAADASRGPGTARLALPRLGLGAGCYDVLARLTPRGAERTEPLRTALVVAPDEDPAAGNGLVRLEHAWSMVGVPPVTVAGAKVGAVTSGDSRG